MLAMISKAASLSQLGSSIYQHLGLQATRDDLLFDASKILDTTAIQVAGPKKKDETKGKGGLMTQLRRKVRMFKSCSVDSALPSSPPLLDCSETIPGKVFGRSLQSMGDTEVPDVIVMILKHLHAHGLYVEGIFRKNAKASVIRDLRERLDQDQHVTLTDYTPHVIASLLKEFLRSLPESLLMSQEKLETWIQIIKLDESHARVTMTRSIIASLPVIYQSTLKHLLCLLHTVAECREWNQMNTENLGICFAYSLLHLPDGDASLNSNNTLHIQKVTSFLVENFVTLFGKESTRLLGSKPPPPDQEASTVDSAEQTNHELPKRQSTSSTDSLPGCSRSLSALQPSHFPPASVSQDSDLADPIIIAERRSDCSAREMAVDVQFATRNEKKVSSETGDVDEPVERHTFIRSSISNTLHRSVNEEHIESVHETTKVCPESPAFMSTPVENQGSVSENPMTPKDSLQPFHQQLSGNTPRKPPRYRKVISPTNERSKSVSERLDSNESDEEASRTPRCTTESVRSPLVTPTEAKNTNYAQSFGSIEEPRPKSAASLTERPKLSRGSRSIPPKKNRHRSLTRWSFDSSQTQAMTKQSSHNGDSSTITDESTLILSRESFGAHELRSKAAEMLGGKTGIHPFYGVHTRTVSVRRTSSQTSSPFAALSSLNEASDPLQSIPNSRAHSCPKVVYETIYQPAKSDLSACAVLSASRSTQLRSKEATTETSMGSGKLLKHGSKLPLHDEVTNDFQNTRQKFELASRKTGQSSLSSSISENSPTSSAAGTRGMIHVSRAEPTHQDHTQLVNIGTEGVKERVSRSVRKPLLLNDEHLENNTVLRSSFLNPTEGYSLSTRTQFSRYKRPQSAALTDPTAMKQYPGVFIDENTKLKQSDRATESYV